MIYQFGNYGVVDSFNKITYSWDAAKEIIAAIFL